MEYTHEEDQQFVDDEEQARVERLNMLPFTMRHSIQIIENDSTVFNVDVGYSNFKFDDSTLYAVTINFLPKAECFIHPMLIKGRQIEIEYYLMAVSEVLMRLRDG